MKLEAYEKCVFFLPPPPPNPPSSPGAPKCWPHLMKGPSEWDRPSVRGREGERQRKTTWDETKTASLILATAILNYQNCCHLRVRPPHPSLPPPPKPPDSPIPAFLSASFLLFFLFCLNINIYIGKWGNRGKSWGDSPHAAPEHLSLTSASWCMNAKKKSKKTKKENSRNWCKKLV